MIATNNYAGTTYDLQIFQDHKSFHDCEIENKRLKKSLWTSVAFRWSTQGIGQLWLTNGNGVCKSIILVFIPSENHGKTFYRYKNSVLGRWNV